MECEELETESLMVNINCVWKLTDLRMNTTKRTGKDLDKKSNGWNSIKSKMQKQNEKKKIKDETYILSSAARLFSIIHSKTKLL